MSKSAARLGRHLVGSGAIVEVMHRTHHGSDTSVYDKTAIRQYITTIVQVMCQERMYQTLDVRGANQLER